MIMAGRGRHLDDTNEEPNKVGTQIFSEDTIVDLPSLKQKITEIDTSNINLSLLMNIQSMFKQLFTSKESIRDVLSDLHSKALEDSVFGEKFVLALEQISHLEIDGTLVRGELLTFIQNDFKAKETMAETDKKKLLNSVILLGNVYHRFKVCGAPIVILGIALLEYLDLLIKGDKEELKVLTEQVLINGSKLSQVKNFEVFIQNLRTTLINTNINSVSRCWILLAMDFISNDMKPLKGTIHDFYVKNLGEEYTKLESLIPVQNEKLLHSPTSPNSVTNPDSTSPRNKSFNSPPNKTDGFKKDLSKKFSDMNLKSGSGPKGKTQSPHNKSNKKEGWKSSGGGRGGSGHDDRFDKEENFYGVQQPRQPKPFNPQKKKLNDAPKISKKGNDDLKTDFNKVESQQGVENES